MSGVREYLFIEAGRCRLAAVRAEGPERKRLLRLAAQFELQALRMDAPSFNPLWRPRHPFQDRVSP